MSKNKTLPKMNVKIIKAAEKPIKKADAPKALADEKESSSIWISHPIDLRALLTLVDHSTILPQCICAYKNNITGFGIGVRYKEDVEETEEMANEYMYAEKVLDLLNIDMDTKEVFEALVETREIYGISYLEVIRSFDGKVSQVELIKDVPTVTKSIRLDPVIDVEYYYNGEAVTRKRKFCKYRQEKNGKTVYFKEFGDPRIMDLRDGRYLESGESLDLEYQANEILEFPIGIDDYGKIRWMGQILSIDGARKAESLNNSYFDNGRHTPLAIIVRGGTLSDESFAKLENYMNEIKGSAGQHAFLVLEVEDSDDRPAFDEGKQPAVELKDMAGILQTDELFQAYLDNTRRKVQSAFRLPDLYVGYTTDFNRSTAQTAMEVTEKQVFQPERKSLAWIINNKLFNDFQFKHVEFYFKEPDISNPDDLYKILAVTERAGGVTPNLAKRIAHEAIGQKWENYEGEWGDIPLQVSNPGKQSSGSGLDVQLSEQILKAESNSDHEVVAVMKEVRKLLCEMHKED
ncbi:MAG: phage portal protein [Monoglobales bacterium]